MRKNNFGSLSVKAGIDKNHNPTHADRIAGAKMARGGRATLKKGGRVGKKKQGYKDRKDESIAMRIKKKRTKKQLKASRDESYGRFGSKAKKSGKINR